MLLNTSVIDDDSAAGIPASESYSDKKDLVVKHLVKSFSKDAKPVLNGVNFSVDHGESIALIGANGTGKSTLLRCCLGLLPTDAGEVSVLGHSVIGASQKQLRAIRGRSGFVFQKHNLVPRLSALTNVIHGCQSWENGIRTWNQAIAKQAIREYAMHCLHQVGLADYAKKRVDQLSGGQSQRVAIARALMQKPVMIFADEPVASLDPVAGEEVMNLFVRLIKEKNITLIFSSHHIGHAQTYSDRVIGLKNGVVDLDLPVSQLQKADLRGFYD